MGSDGKQGKKDVLDLDDPFSRIVPVLPGQHRDRQSTLLDDEATEQARIASVLMDSMPPAPGSAAAIRKRLGSLGRVPVLAKSLDALGDDMKEPKTAFVIGFVDGVLPLETIIEVTGLPELDTLQILERLIAQGAIVFPNP